MPFTKPCRDAITKRFKLYDETAQPRFWNTVNVLKVMECWLWGGTIGGRGYGQFRIKNKPHSSHRLAYQFTYGEIPSGMMVCHKCDNPACCNPTHLFLGTNSDNQLDCVSKGRNHNTEGPNNPMFGKVGEKHHNSIFTDFQAQEIIALYKTGLWTQKRLAERYQSKQVTISCITRGKTWKHLKR